MIEYLRCQECDNYFSPQMDHSGKAESLIIFKFCGNCYKELTELADQVKEAKKNRRSPNKGAPNPFDYEYREV